MSKYQHAQDEVARIAGTVAGLVVTTSGPGNVEPARPYCRVYDVGDSGTQGHEGRSQERENVYVLQCYVESGSDDADGLNGKRNTLAQSLQYAFDTETIAPYSDAQYRCEYSAAVSDVSPIYDDDGKHGAFVVTVSVSYFQSLA